MSQSDFSRKRVKKKCVSENGREDLPARLCTVANINYLPEVERTVSTGSCGGIHRSVLRRISW